MIWPKVGISPGRGGRNQVNKTKNGKFTEWIIERRIVGPLTREPWT